MDNKTGYKAPPAPRPGEFAGTRIALIATRWNTEIVDALLAGARRQLAAWGVAESHVAELRAPGSYEMPLACELAAASGRYDGIVALGAVIRGETPHFDYVAGECARGLQDVMLKRRVPVGFGVLTVNTVEQAVARAGTGADNKGGEAAAAVLEMIRLARELESQ
ncbi:MAG: 6,7-dimethyl-8-ribityllumazine synthase [Gammaproteobacteria bacterium]|nr:6,7-dimethyl-8-ribityllumazine synthase [Gammaproteobacteria bacterium]